MENEKKLHLFHLAEKLGNMGHWGFEVPSNTLFWSDQIYVIHGVSKYSYTPTLETAIDFYHPGDRRRVTELVENSVSKGEDFEFTLRIVRPDGTIRHVASSGHCEKDENGSVTNIIGVFQDISDQMAMLVTGERLELAYSGLVESTSDGIWDWYIQEDYEYMSPRFWEMFGYTPEEKPHKPSAWQDMIFQEDLTEALKNFNKHVATKGEYPYCQEVRYRHKNGSTVTVLCKGRVIEWADDGAPLRMVGTHSNITETKQNEQRLRESIEFQSLLINASQNLIFVKDEHFRIVSANDAFLSLYPEDIRDSVIGTTTLEDYLPEEADAFLTEDKRAFAEGVSEVLENVNFPNGELRNLLTKKVRFYDAQKNPYILGIATDVTELKLTELALEHANEELEEFAYRTSHDLRSPLVSSLRLLGFISRDIQKNKTEHALKNIELVQGTLNNLSELVTGILTLTKLQHEVSDAEALNVEDVIDKALNKVSYMEGFDTINFTKSGDFEQTLLVKKEQFTHVVENLLSNAIKYQDQTKASSQVETRIIFQGNECHFSVKDNGLGIPEASRDKVFSMFKRFHAKTSFGSGLGLYMVKKSVDRMGGCIEYIPHEDGSEFLVKIPQEI